jgi:two-component system NtrC family sensor kinase
MTLLPDILNRLAAGQIPAEVPEDCDCRDELQHLVDYLAELNRFTQALAAGNLDATLRLPGSLAGSLKGLHANLRHLTWQTQQVAAGDFTQRVAFLGEFSTAFNAMVMALAQARDDLVERNRQLAAAYDELKMTQAQLLQQEKMASIGQLAAGVAHEINNPIGFIASNLGTLKKYAERFGEFIAAQDEAISSSAPADVQIRLAETRRRLKIDFALTDVQGLVAESAEGTERVRVIVQNLKSFAHLDEAEWQEADLNACLESTISIACNEIKYKAVLERQFGVLPGVYCRPQQLNQVFLNLLVNAAQAMESQGLIRVRSWQDGSSVCVAISDNGCGMPDDIKHRIFEPFFTTKDVGKGTGLGLSISYDIVKKHNGTIDVESEAGKGTTFTIRLPVGGRTET